MVGEEGAVGSWGRGRILHGRHKKSKYTLAVAHCNRYMNRQSVPYLPSADDSVSFVAKYDINTIFSTC